MKDSVITSSELDVKIRRIFLLLSRRRVEEKDPQKASLGQSLGRLKKLPVGVNFLSRKYKKLIEYLLILHYFPLERSVFCYVYLDLQDLLEETEAFWLSVLLDKDLFLKYLVVQETMTEQQFFSGICNVSYLQEALRQIVFRFEEKLQKPKRLIRHKGYRDKGSLGQISTQALRRGVQEDFYLTIAQFQIEEEQILKSELCTLLEEFLREGRVLTDETLVLFKIKKGEVQNERNRNSEEQNYVIERSREKIIRKERKDRQTAERSRIQEIESGSSTFDSNS